MSQERDVAVESVTQPDETGSPTRSTMTSEQANPKETAHDEPPTPQAKGKAKRRPSISLSPPTPKRMAMTVFEPPEKQFYAYSDPSLPKYSIEETTKLKNSSALNLWLTYHTGDMFSAPPGTLLIHACNTQGHWGAGIAKAFKTKYPKAYTVHHNFCAKEHSKSNPVPTGTAQLIAPVDNEDGPWIGCLFTSAKYGKAKDPPSQIVKNTADAMEMLLRLVKIADEENGVCIGDLRMCKINSGKFGVPWEMTAHALKSVVRKPWMRGQVEVWEPLAV